MDILNQAISLHKQGQFDKAEFLYQRLLNRKPFEECLLFLLGDLYLRKDSNGMAINLLSSLLQHNPGHAEAWCNLGIGYRKEGFLEQAKQAWQQSIKLAGETSEVCNNMAGLYADRAQPQEALEWCEKSLKLKDTVEARWQKALALLSMKDWAAGWALYSNRQQLDTWDSRKTLDVPQWDFGPVGHLYIHGEQGIGDEVMFACGLPHVKAEKVTIEVHAKVAPLIQQTYPHYRVVTVETPGDYDAKIPIGSLVGRFGFHPQAYLKPDPARVAFYRQELEKLGPGPYVALTWVGGTKQTRVEERSIHPKDLKPILDAFTCVSAQYSDSNPMVEIERNEMGLRKISDACTGLDIAEQAALFKAVDAVVTVQQTAVHVAGSVGAKTYAMISQTPHWRYGVEGQMPWYESVKLFRQKTDWAEVIDNVLKELHADFPRVQRTEQKAA